MKQYRSHLAGAWHDGQGEPIDLVDPSTEAVIAQVRAASDLGEAVTFARDVGGAEVRAASFAERGTWLKKLGKLLHEHREELLSLSVTSGGNTRQDAKFDVDGAAAVVAHYAHLAKQLGESPWLLASEATELMRGSKLRAHDIALPRRGVAIHINAFNFPAWGMVGKLAVALLAGMPVLSKPATSTSALAGRIAELIIDSQVLPKGAFSLLMGPAGDLLDHVGPQDVIAFTGSADTGRRIRAHEAVLRAGTRVNLEADSLNAAIVGIDVEPGTDLFDVLVRDLVVEMTQKAGQKCTATRRVLVPEPLLARLRERLIDRLGEIAAKTGNPADEGVRMGPLATRAQLHDAHRGIEALANGAARIFGDPSRTQFVGVEAGKGFFLEPLVFEATSEAASDRTAVFHHREVFGPVTTLLPYDGELATASRIVAHGQGNLVGTFYSDDRKLMRRAVAEIGSHVGRMVLVHEKIAGASMCPGGVFPVVHHGGPGRAGDGAELDGTFGLGLYMQRTTLQGGGGQLARILGG